jgi:hypothetical protein
MVIVKNLTDICSMTDPSFIDKYESSMKLAAGKVREQLAGLSDTQLNWKPGPDTWSAGQCLEHLIVSNSTYFPTFEKIARGEYKMSTWERWSPLSGIWGRMLANQLQEEVKMKMKTPAVFEPTHSHLDVSVFKRFDDHLHTFAGHLQSFRSMDLDRIVITSPAASMITYSLRHAIMILVPHLHRHINQAIRLKSATGFPG